MTQRLMVERMIRGLFGPSEAPHDDDATVVHVRGAGADAAAAAEDSWTAKWPSAPWARSC